MLHAFLSILPLFLLIVSGYFVKKYFFKEEVFWKTSDKLTYYLFFPSLLILKIGTTDFSTAFPMGALYATVGATFLIALLSFVSKGVFKIENALFTSIFQGAIRYNSYVFIAMSQSLFGEEGVAFSGVFVAYMIVFTNIISVLVLNHYGDGEKKMFGVFLKLYCKTL